MIYKEIYELIKYYDLMLSRRRTSIFVGDHKSSQHGSGFIFDQLKEYEPGDDIRTLDWPSFARTQKLQVRRYHEERSHEIVIIVDCSFSMRYGSTEMIKWDQAMRIALVLMLLSQRKKFRCNLLIAKETGITFSGIQSTSNIVRACEKMSTASLSGLGLVAVQKKLLAGIKRPSSIFIISDFLYDMDKNFYTILTKKHDITGIQILDRLEQDPIQVLAQIYDGRIASSCFYDLASLKPSLSSWKNTIEQTFKKFKIPFLRVTAHDKELQSLCHFLSGGYHA